MRSLAVFLAVSWPLVAASPAIATPTLIGETVQLELINFSDTGELISSTVLDSATVGGGIEFTSGIEPEIFDIAADSITISQEPASFVSWSLLELDEHILTFSGTTIITNAVLDPGHGVANLTQTNVSFGSQHVSIVWAGTEWDGTEVVSISLTLIPEPSTASLLGVGLAGIAAAGRRRAN